MATVGSELDTLPSFVCFQVSFFTSLSTDNTDFYEINIYDDTNALSLVNTCIKVRLGLNMVVKLFLRNILHKQWRTFFSAYITYLNIQGLGEFLKVMQTLDFV